MFRARSIPLLALLLAGSAAGCEGIDWNWDTAWWKRPRRVVRPDRSEGRSVRRPPASQGDDARDQVSEDVPSPMAAERPAVPDAPIPSVAIAQPSKPKVRAFYRLYLLGEEMRDPAMRGEYHYSLKQVDARACAALLGMLYVPIGCSGSDKERYLIYEQRDEFDAACEIVARLDVAPSTTVKTVDDAGEPLVSGIAALLHMINAGAIVDRSLMDRCEHRLAEAAHSPQTPTRERWAAAVFAGKLLADYRYDYAGARSYFTQARRFVASGSVEAMTADWWRADTLAQEGKLQQAEAAYERLVETYDPMMSKSQIIVRSAAKLKKMKDQSS